MKCFYYILKKYIHWKHQLPNYPSVSTRSHLWIAAGVISVPISLCVTMNNFKGGRMGAGSG
jgi:hypothetical protein